MKRIIFAHLQKYKSSSQMRVLLLTSISLVILFLSCKSEPTEKYIKMAEAINFKTPFEFNRGMRLDSAKAVSAKEFKYYYTLLNNPNTSSGNFINSSKPQIINNLKGSASALDFKKDNMTIVYSYHKADGSSFAEFEVHPEEY